MIRCNRDVSGAVAQQSEHRADDSTHRADLVAIGVLAARHGIEVAEQLVRTIYQVSIHNGSPKDCGNPRVSNSLMLRRGYLPAWDRATCR